MPTFHLMQQETEPGLFVWRRAAEDFVALRFTTFIYQLLHELRHTLTFALVSTFLLVLSILSYPFRGAYVLQMYCWMLVIVGVLMGLWRMLALERNELLSCISGSRPDHIEWNANFLQLALFVGLPVVAVVGVFPGLGDALSAQISMVLRVRSLAN